MASLARTARRSLPSLSRPYALPQRAGITTVSHTLDTSAVPEPLIQSGHRIPQDSKDKATTIYTPHTKPTQVKASPHSRQDVVSTHLTPSIRQLLPLLQTQPAHYITAHIHGHPYLLTKGDTLRLPFNMPKVQPGDVLRLNRATHIGSRDYTLKAPEVIKGTADHGKKVFYLDERMYTCRATVMGVESEPLRVEEKTKRRQRHVKHVKSKMRYTVLRVSELEVKSLEEYEGIVKGEVAQQD
jgi:large subunit ribosomal protein L21